MKEDTWRATEAVFAQFPIMKAERVELEEVDAAMHELGMPLPSDYREFVRRYGGAIVGPYPIFGVRRAEPMGRDEGSALAVTRRFQHMRWPGTEAWLVISTDHGGNPIGLDAEGKVWISDHDSGQVIVIANSFEGYLRKHCLKLAD